MTLKEVVTKVFLTDVKPEDIQAVGEEDNLIYIIDYKANPLNTTWWHIKCTPTQTALILRCILAHGNFAFFKDHNGRYHLNTDKLLDGVTIIVNNITNAESEWDVKYY